VKRFEQLMAAFEAGHPALSIELGKLVLAEEPDLVPALMIYGSALASVARHDEALAVFEHVLQVAPPESYRRIYQEIGHIHRARGEPREAEVAYRRASAYAPLDASPYIYLGGMLAGLGRLSEAEELHRSATRCVEGCIDEAWLNLGFVLRAQGRYFEALECFRRVLALEADDATAAAAVVDLEQVLFEFPVE
jgi:tetratricopeptide (TPR) repeat protein